MSTQEVPLKPDFRERAKANDVPVARLIGFEAKDIANGRATVVLRAGPQHANPVGTLHGGILCDIADAAMGMAFASTLAAEESFTTVELKINFFRSVWQAQLKAEGTVVQRGRTVSPGPINTPLASRQSADVIARIVSTIPMGRMGEPEEVAKVVKIACGGIFGSSPSGSTFFAISCRLFNKQIVR